MTSQQNVLSIFINETISGKFDSMTGELLEKHSIIYTVHIVDGKDLNRKSLDPNKNFPDIESAINGAVEFIRKEVLNNNQNASENKS